MDRIIDLRSDTVTKPGKEMLEFMISAEVGDDVYGEDPTVNLLENRLAEYFKMEAALYSPTGTMSNQIGIKAHTQPGDELICDKSSHVFQYEGGGIAFNSGVQVNTVSGERGLITAKHIAPEVNNKEDIHKAYSRVVSLENTANRGGGSCYSIETLLEIKNLCINNELKLHLDGARLFNAIVATGQNPEDYGKIFDSISVCLNKGLGCPAGSVLIGTRDYIKKARRIRKVLGGGLRQSGYLAACGLYALDHNIERLKTDHEHAKLIETALINNVLIESVIPVETNIVIAKLKKEISSKTLISAFKEKNILIGAISEDMIRMVTHLDIKEDMISRLIDFINTVQIK